MKTEILALFCSLLAFVSCAKNNGSAWTPDNLPDDPVIEEPEYDSSIHKFKAPLYWSVYEYAYTQEGAGIKNIDMTESQWDEVIDWFATNLKPYGYDMICTDGFMWMHSDINVDPSGYMVQYGSMPLKKLVEKCKAKGIKLGVYDNPLWVHDVPDETLVEGTGVPVATLRYNDAQDRKTVLYPDKGDLFGWTVPSHKGTKEYIEGFFRYYKSIGVEFIRMDFLCLFEDASCDVFAARGYGREAYVQAFQWIKEAAHKYGVFTSLVMPNNYNDAEVEKNCGNMFRIVEDTVQGGWDHISARERGVYCDHWSNWKNQFDGFVYWSHVAGRDKVILDGDFIRLNTFDSDNECEFSISLNLMAGGPIAVADQPSTIGDRLRFYQNEEMLALNKDRFVGKPLSTDLKDERSQIWAGQMSNGDWVIALFNRENREQNRMLNFQTLGIEGEMNVRDLWKHQDEGKARSISVNLAPHSCKVVKLNN